MRPNPGLPCGGRHIKLVAVYSDDPQMPCLAWSRDVSLKELLDNFAPRFSTRRGRASRLVTVLYDTFGWDLWFAKCLLVHMGDTLTLAHLSGGWMGPEIRSCTVNGRPPAMAEHFADADLKSALKPVLGSRALQPVAEFILSEQVVSLLDGRQKTVFRFALIQVSANRSTRKPILRLIQPRPMRGYDAECHAARLILGEQGALPVAGEHLVSVLSRCRPAGTVVLGDGPTVHTLRPEFGIQGHQPAREACRRIIQRMLEMARHTEAGIIRDIDMEFLHDYRICIRKVRSVLSLVEGIYPPAQTARLRQQLKGLAQMTNRLRDLDVYLLARDSYTGMLPASLKDGLKNLYDHFAESRARELARIVKRLNSAAYNKQMENLQGFFAGAGDESGGSNASAEIGTLVAQRIRKAYKRIRRMHHSLHSETPDEEVHALRIQCKKLRYLLEFFRELFRTGDVDVLIQSLKKLQSHLGDFNDCSVQQNALLAHAEDCAHEGRGSVELSMAVGGLVAVLHARQLQTRKRITATLNVFCRRDIADQFKHLTAET